jgi:hypothetical protein
MIAFCGLDCEQCEASVATRNNDDALRAKVASEWTTLYNAPIRPEDINCTGCQSAGVKTYYCDQLCEIRKCATTKSVRTCGDCADYSCSMLDEILRAAPQAKANLDALRSN